VVEQVRQVVADRAAGLSLPAAVQRARTGGAHGPGSLHAGLRHRRQDLHAHRFTKRVLTALSHAVEDEGHNRAESPVLVTAGFQQEHYYRHAQDRWRDLSRGATMALVFADFATPGTLTDRPIEVPIGAVDALRREWFVLWYGPRYSACISARELPGQSRVADADRSFETIWGVDSGLVREAAELICAQAVRCLPDLPVADVLRTVPSSPADDMAVMSALTNRMMAYLAALVPGA
jgi:DICT domain-containing protein